MSSSKHDGALPVPSGPQRSRFRTWLAARSAYQVVTVVVVVVVALLASLGGYYLASGHDAAASPVSGRSSVSAGTSGGTAPPAPSASRG